MKRKKILLVEDQKIALLSAKLMLVKLECEVDIAESGSQALELANENRYDIIFMDIGLSDLDGIAVTHKIRENLSCKNNNTPIIALTAHGGHHYKTECQKVGFNDFFVKPLTEEAGKEFINIYVMHADPGKHGYNK